MTTSAVIAGWSTWVGEDIPRRPDRITARTTTDVPFQNVRARGVGTRVGPLRVLAEVRTHFGGHAAAALVRGQFQGDRGEWLRVSVETSGRLARGEPKAVHGPSGTPYARGIPDEFSSAILDAAEMLPPELVPPGHLALDGGAHSELDSSQLAFRHVTQLLLAAINNWASGGGVVAPVGLAAIWSEHRAR